MHHPGCIFLQAETSKKPQVTPALVAMPSMVKKKQLTLENMTRTSEMAEFFFRRILFSYSGLTVFLVLFNFFSASLAPGLC